MKITILFLFISSLLLAQSPSIFSKDGKYLGSLNINQYDPNSVSNSHGKYGSKYSAESINNDFGSFGNPYSSESVNNPYGGEESPKLYSSDGEYLGNLNKNKYDPNSVSNPYGEYGNKFSPKSINNKYGEFGSKYSPNSVNNPYGSGEEFKLEDKTNWDADFNWDYEEE